MKTRFVNAFLFALDWTWDEFWYITLKFGPWFAKITAFYFGIGCIEIVLSMWWELGRLGTATKKTLEGFAAFLTAVAQLLAIVLPFLLATCMSVMFSHAGYMLGEMAGRVAYIYDTGGLIGSVLGALALVSMFKNKNQSTVLAIMAGWVVWFIWIYSAGAFK